MIGFLLKGLIRDRQRSLYPGIVVVLGTALTVVLHCWITGIIGDMIDYSARFSTGHVKITTRAYADNADQIPNDLALMGVDALIADLKKTFPEMDWVRRIRFGGLLDVPDEHGETGPRAPTIGLAVDLLSGDSKEIRRLDIEKSLVRGRMPEKPGEILISDEFASKLGVGPGDEATLLSSTMYGSMAMRNFTIAGAVSFGVQALDRSGIFTDITDAQAALDMTDAAGEILGYFKSGFYDDERAKEIAERFNAGYADSKDEFAPKMLPLTGQMGLSNVLEYVESMTGLFIGVFVGAMSIILWNVGLIGGVRRYGEIGVRLAVGESKGAVYRAMIVESLAVGVVSSVVGTALGLAASYWLETKGIDISSVMKSASIMMPNVFRAHITKEAYYIGFVPGLFSTVLGTLLAGIGIYRRSTARLFKELEV